MRDPLRDARAWLHQAERNLEAARLLTERFPALACFHAQQSAGKALKAALYAAGERPVLGHALAELGHRVLRHDPSYAELHAEVAKLDRYYIGTRYPNGLPAGAEPDTAFDEGDARFAIATASRALTAARRSVEDRANAGGSASDP
jgi:HEPN domain-containing protein